MDSMAEFEQHIAVGYLKNIRRLAKRFLHINQEAQVLDKRTFWRQGVIRALIEEVNGFDNSYRFPDWMLEGYVEELYEITPDS
jgi:hypothetical protein